MIAQPKDTRPSPLPVLRKGLPPELAGIAGYVAWRYQYRDGRWTKPAIDAAGRLIDVTDPATWRPLPAVLAQLDTGGCDGIGIATGALRAAGIVALDLDHCMGDNGEPLPWAEEIVETFPTYWELSPSAEGLRAFCAADLPDLPTNVKKNGIELHAGRGYVTLTGHRLAGTPATVEACQAATEALLRRLRPPEGSTALPPPTDGPTALLDDDDVIEKALRARNGATIRALWEGDDLDHASASEADAALAAALAFYVRGNVGQLLRLMDRSERGQRPKWRDRPDYRRRTCERAIQTCTRHYEPPPPRPRLLIGGKAADGQSQGGDAGQAEEPARIAGGTEDPGDGMPQTLSAAHALIRQLTAEVEAERQRADRLAAQLRDTRAERDTLRQVSSRQMAVLRNKDLGPSERAVLIGVSNIMANRETAGGDLDPRGHKIPHAAIAEAAGIGESTSCNTIKKLKACGLMEQETVYEPEAVNPETGEITPPRERQYLRPAAGSAAAMLEAAAAIKIEGKKARGGKRQRRCPDHPNAAVIRETTWRCDECDMLLDRETAMVAPTGEIEVEEETVVVADPPRLTRNGVEVAPGCKFDNPGDAESPPVADPVLSTRNRATREAGQETRPPAAPGFKFETAVSDDDPPRFSDEWWAARQAEQVKAWAEAGYPPQASA